MLTELGRIVDEHGEEFNKDTENKIKYQNRSHGAEKYNSTEKYTRHGLITD